MYTLVYPIRARRTRYYRCVQHERTVSRTGLGLCSRIILKIKLNKIFDSRCHEMRTPTKCTYYTKYIVGSTSWRKKIYCLLEFIYVYEHYMRISRTTITSFEPDVYEFYEWREREKFFKKLHHNKRQGGKKMFIIKIPRWNMKGNE